MTPKQLKQTKL